MKQLCAIAAIAVACMFPVLSQKSSTPFAGRWDMTVTRGSITFPSWMEVREKDGRPEVRVQQRTGNVSPVAGAQIDGSRLIITVSDATPARPAEGNREATPARPEMVGKTRPRTRPWPPSAGGNR